MITCALSVVPTASICCATPFVAYDEVLVGQSDNRDPVVVRERIDGDAVDHGAKLRLLKPWASHCQSTSRIKARTASWFARRPLT
jgi:hypothetical protein